MPSWQERVQSARGKFTLCDTGHGPRFACVTATAGRLASIASAGAAQKLGCTLAVAARHYHSTRHRGCHRRSLGDNWWRHRCTRCRYRSDRQGRRRTDTGRGRRRCCNCWAHGRSARTGLGVRLLEAATLALPLLHLPAPGRRVDQDVGIQAGATAVAPPMPPYLLMPP
jgi:hypothetical protein